MGILKKGTTGADTLTSTASGDTLSGGTGNDTYVVAHANVVIEDPYSSAEVVMGHGSTYQSIGGTDKVKTSYLDAAGVYSLRSFHGIENLDYTGSLAARLQGNDLANIINGNKLNDTIEGGRGDDRLNGLAGDDLISGGAGNDTLDGGVNGTGGDTMVGGAGDDLYYVNSGADQTLEGVNRGFDTIQSAGTVKTLNLGKYINFEGLRYTGTTAATLTGNAASNQVTSTSGTADKLYGLAGNDTLDGGGGADSMYGGVGDDTYVVGSTDKVYENANQGIDTLRGTIKSLNTTTAGANFATTLENLTYTGADHATLTGNNLDNFITGGNGNNNIGALNGNDTVDGAAGNDSISAGNGNDWIIGGSGTDTLVGGSGDDRYVIADSLDKVTEGADSVGGANDWIYSNIDIKLGNTKYANVNNLLLTGDSWSGEGTAGANVIVGNGEGNYLAGLGGNDILIGSGYGVIGSAITITSGGYYYTAQNDDLLDGGAGNDILIGGTGSTVYDGEGDALLGGAGNDTYIIRHESSTVSDSGGIDTVISLVNDTLSLEDYAGIEKAKLSDYYGGLPELTALTTSLSKAGVNASFGSGSYYGFSGGLIGNDLANTLTGNTEENLLDGGIGNDTLYGGDGGDTLIGGAGNDSLVGGNDNDVYEIDSGDVIVETATGGNADAIRSSTITSLGSGYANIEGLYYTGTASVAMNGTANGDLLGGGSGNDTISGLSGIDTLQGGDGNDSISGGNDSDSLSGEGGADILDGGSGNDYLYGNAGGDKLSGGEDNDYLYGGSANYADGNKLTGNDTLDGGAGNDNLQGGDGADSLTGGGGDDVLYGGGSDYGYDDDTQTGNDTLDGGSGNDELHGGDGDDVLNATGQALSSSYYNVSGDELHGGDGKDTFRLSEAYATTDGYGTGYFATGHLIADFLSGQDKLSIAKTLVGNGDTTLTSATATAGTGSSSPLTTFSQSAELVVFSGDTGIEFSYSQYSGINAYVTSAAVATAIGSASANFAAGDERVFVLNDGDDSAIFQFVSAGADAVVSGTELKLIGVVSGDASLLASDFSLF